MKNLYLFLIFVFSVFSFNFKVSAEQDLGYDFFSYYDSLSDDNLYSIHNYLSQYYSETDFKIICSLPQHNFVDESNNALFYCIKLNDDDRFSILYSIYFSVNNSYSNYDLFSLNLNDNVVSFSSSGRARYFVYNYWTDVYTGPNIYFPYVLWSNKQFKYSDIFDFSSNDSSLLTYSKLNNVSSRYKAYFPLNYFYSDNDDNLYTIYNRVTGAFVDSLFDYEYTVYYYFDDLLNSDYTKNFVYSGYIGDYVLITDLDDNIGEYTLVNNEYGFYVSNNNNYINIYYESEMYNKQFYTINIYLDDIYSTKYSYTSYGTIGDMLDLSNLSDTIEDIYVIDSSFNEFIINSQAELNNFNIYYFSDYYGTEFQDIDLSDSRLYLFFQYQDIKEMFPMIHWSNFNQFNQMVITISFNLFFCLFLLFILFIVLRLLSKLFSFIF